MTTANHNLQELEQLVSKLLDNSISSEDLDRLEDALRSDPEARSRYAEFMTVESMLHWEFANAAEEVSASKVRPLIDFSLWLRPAMALAACLVAALTGWWVLNSGISSQEEEDVATVSSKEKSTVVAEIGALAKTSTVSGQPVQAMPPPVRNVVVFGSDANEVVASTVSAAPGVDLVQREREALLDAAYGVEILKSGQGFGEGGYVEVTEKVTAWRAEDDLRVGTEFGVQPFEGMDMLRFSRMEVDVFKQQAEVSELVRVLDVRTLGEEISDNKTVVKSTVRFNQGVGIADAGTAFALSLHAIDQDGNLNIAVGREETRVMSDGNPATWERVESEMELPEGTDFVVVALSAHKEGPQALLPDLSGHYADDLEIAMAVEGRPVYGRL